MKATWRKVVEQVKSAVRLPDFDIGEALEQACEDLGRSSGLVSDSSQNRSVAPK